MVHTIGWVGDSKRMFRISVGRTKYCHQCRGKEEKLPSADYDMLYIIGDITYRTQFDKNATDTP